VSNHRRVDISYRSSQFLNDLMILKIRVICAKLYNSVQAISILTMQEVVCRAVDKQFLYYAAVFAAQVITVANEPHTDFNINTYTKP